MAKLPERFWNKVEMSGSCWLWIAHKNRDGYGTVCAEGKKWLAHRFSYSSLVGPIPDGLQLDHLCRVRHCVNPEHLEAVTHRVNVQRGKSWAVHQAARTHCPQGHAYSPENTRVCHGSRHCRACDRDRHRAAYAKKKAAQ